MQTDPDRPAFDPVRLRLSSLGDRASLRASIESLLGPDGSAPACLLVDVRGAAAPTEDLRVYIGALAVVFLAQSRTAVLADKTAVNRVAETVAVRAGVAMRVFWDEPAALAWLHSAAPAAPRS